MGFIITTTRDEKCRNKNLAAAAEELLPYSWLVDVNMESGVQGYGYQIQQTGHQRDMVDNPARGKQNRANRILPVPVRA